MSAAVDRAKEAAARSAVDRLSSERHIALGTGSTADYAVRAIAKRFPGGSGFEFVASSRATEELARSVGLTVRAVRGDDRFEVMLDGADEVTPALDLTKGGGGALFREKFLARLSNRLVVMVDPSKLVDRLGSRHRIPVEVVPFAREVLTHVLTQEGFDVQLRIDPQRKVIRTDNGNEILDLKPSQPVEDPRALDVALRGHTGVVETGIFAGMADEVIVGREDGHVEVRSAPSRPGRRR
jgi:ribose 5-phosphate isomerase A